MEGAWFLCHGWNLFGCMCISDSLTNLNMLRLTELTLLQKVCICYVICIHCWISQSLLLMLILIQAPAFIFFDSVANFWQWGINDKGVSSKAIPPMINQFSCMPSRRLEWELSIQSKSEYSWVILFSLVCAWIFSILLHSWMINFQHTFQELWVQVFNSVQFKTECSREWFWVLGFG